MFDGLTLRRKTVNADDYSHLLRDIVQSILALSLTGAVIYMSCQGAMPTEILAGLAGTAVGFYLAERKNGEERLHAERMADRRL